MLVPLTEKSALSPESSRRAADAVARQRLPRRAIRSRSGRLSLINIDIRHVHRMNRSPGYRRRGRRAGRCACSGLPSACAPVRVERASWLWGWTGGRWECRPRTTGLCRTVSSRRRRIIRLRCVIAAPGRGGEQMLRGGITKSDVRQYADRSIRRWASLAQLGGHVQRVAPSVSAADRLPCAPGAPAVSGAQRGRSRSGDRVGDLGGVQHVAARPGGADAVLHLSPLASHQAARAVARRRRAIRGDGRRFSRTLLVSNQFHGAPRTRLNARVLGRGVVCGRASADRCLLIVGPVHAPP